MLMSSNGETFEEQVRIHKCACSPCTADWDPKSGKYGKVPAPWHVRSCEPISEAPDVNALPASTAVAEHAQPESSMPPPPPLPPPPAPPVQPQIIQQVQPSPEPGRAKALFCMQPPEPASAVVQVTTPQLRRAAVAELTPDEARLQVQQRILDLAREIRRRGQYVGYRVQGFIEWTVQARTLT